MFLASLVKTFGVTRENVYRFFELYKIISISFQSFRESLFSTAAHALSQVALRVRKPCRLLADHEDAGGAGSSLHDVPRASFHLEEEQDYE